MASKTGTTKPIETLCHTEAKRKNIPTAEYQSMLQENQQDWSDLVIHTPPLHIQEKNHPKRWATSRERAA